MRTFNLFVSHSWDYSDAYDKLVNLLRKQRHFAFKDYSVPRDDPIHDAKNAQELRLAIRNQIAPCSVVLILAGVYSTYSRWINEEIALAKHGFENSKPILAIEPWGAERTSVPVQKAADRIVGWNTESIVTAIRSLA